MKTTLFPLLLVFSTPFLLRGDEPDDSVLSQVQLAPELMAMAKEIEKSFNSQDIQKQLGLAAVEFENYYHILRQARDTDPVLLKTAAAEQEAQRRTKLGYPAQSNKPFPTYVDIYQNTGAYLGQPVTLRGWVRKLVKYDAEENEAGIVTQYEAWMYTPDSQQNPAVVICTSVPADMPTPSDKNPVGEVTVTGYLYRRYLYDSHDSKRLVPMILAGKLEWEPAPEPEGIPLWVWLSLGGIGAALAALAGWAGLRDRRSRRAIPTGLKDSDPPPDFSQLTEDSPAPPPG